MSQTTSPEPAAGALLTEIPSTPDGQAPIEPAPRGEGEPEGPGFGAPEGGAEPVRQGAHPKPGFGFLSVISFITLVADLGTKYWAEKALQTAQQIPTPKVILKGALGFGFVLARNRGGAWGLLQGSDEKIRKPFFVVVSLLAIVFIVSLYRRLHPQQNALRWGLPLVLGGALGNLVDRIRYGFVIDFIDFSVMWKAASHHWPTFNVADIAICVGVALMAVDMLSARRHASVMPDPLVADGQAVTEQAPPADETAGASVGGHGDGPAPPAAGLAPEAWACLRVPPRGR